MYREIKKVTDGIRPPQTETTIQKRGSGTGVGTVVYTPPRSRVVEEKLENLIKYLNDDHKYPYDPLIKLAVSHYQFEAITSLPRWQWESGQSAEFITYN